MRATEVAMRPGMARPTVSAPGATAAPAPASTPGATIAVPPSSPVPPPTAGAPAVSAPASPFVSPPAASTIPAKPLSEAPPAAPPAAGAAPVRREPGLFHPDPQSPSQSIRTPPAAAPNRGAPSPVATAPEAGQSEGGGKPGGKDLEGPQTPQLVLQKIAPTEVQVGKPATFQIKVKNSGQATANNVEVRDEVPRGARFLDATPKAARGVRGELVWSLGTMRPGAEATVEVQILPTSEGEIGSVASVAFSAEASARTTATKPELVIKSAAPPKVLIGEGVVLTIQISNPGTGVAQKVFLEERVPPGLQHAAGPELEYDIGDLKPGESRQLELKLTAAQAGMVTNVLAARAEGNLRTEERTEIEILAPQLDIATEGPKRRFLEREATYTFSISNPGTASAKQVELVAQLPAGLKFVAANNAGHYQEATRSVHWTLEELPSRESGSVTLTTVPVEVGQQTLRIRGSAERGLSVEREHPVVIEGMAAILFEVVDTNDPVEVGGETTYEIRVVNQGSKAATNVRISAVLPAEMRAVAAEGPTRHAVDGSKIVFEPLAQLAPKADTTYRLRVQGIKPGDQRVRVQLVTDEMRDPVTKEESTRVYSDE